MTTGQSETSGALLLRPSGIVISTGWAFFFFSMTPMGDCNYPCELPEQSERLRFSGTTYSEDFGESLRLLKKSAFSIIAVVIRDASPGLGRGSVKVRSPISCRMRFAK